MTETLLLPPAAAASAEAGYLLAMLDDQLALLERDTRGLAPDALEWQPGPGHNTIGMLLAHIAIVEAYWVAVVIDGVEPKAFESRTTLGIDDMDDGMPLPEDGAPPPALAGRDIAFFHELLRRARARITPKVLAVGPAELERTVTHPRRDGTLRTVSVRWMLYHVLEHFSGHYGQVLMLKHLHASRTAGQPT